MKLIKFVSAYWISHVPWNVFCSLVSNCFGDKIIKNEFGSDCSIRFTLFSLPTFDSVMHLNVNWKRFSCSYAKTETNRIMPINQKALVLVLFSAICCSCQSLEPDDDNKTIVERPYCFRFTWIGPKYNEESRFKNATCGDIVKDDKTVPCILPLVVTSWVALHINS